MTTVIPDHPQAGPRPRYQFPKTVGPKFVKKVLPWVELYWHKNKRYPTFSEFAQKFGLTTEQLRMLHNSKYYKHCLRDRGISLPNEELTPKQVAAITVITNFSDTRPTNAKLASIGVTEEELNGWYANPQFKTELAARAEDILENVFPEAQAQLARQIKKGNFPALKFYYEITGRAQSPEVINVKMAMTRIVEAVQRHVKDPEILAAIARDMQNIPEISPVAEAAPAAELSLAERYQEFRNGTS